MKDEMIFRHRAMVKLRRRQAGRLFTPAVTVSLCILLAIIFACAFAPLISPYSPTEQNLADSLALPDAMAKTAEEIRTAAHSRAGSFLE